MERLVEPGIPIPSPCKEELSTRANISAAPRFALRIAGGGDGASARTVRRAACSPRRSTWGKRGLRGLMDEAKGYYRPEIDCSCSRAAPLLRSAAAPLSVTRLRRPLNCVVNDGSMLCSCLPVRISEMLPLQ